MSDPETIFHIYKKSILKDLLDSPELQSMIAEEVRRQNTTQQIKTYYTPEEYASFKKIKKQTVYKLFHDGHLNGERVGNSIRIFEVK